MPDYIYRYSATHWEYRQREIRFDGMLFNVMIENSDQIWKIFPSLDKAINWIADNETNGGKIINT